MNIVVFGANSAIAQAVCRLWAKRGDNLYLLGRNSLKLEAFAADLRVRTSSRIISKMQDLSILDEHAHAFREAINAFGRIDLVFIAHGDLSDQKRAELDFTYAEASLRVNFLSPISILTHAAAYFEAEKHGALATITSVAGDRGRASNYVYASAKGGLSIFLSGLRCRLSGLKIPVTDLRLGFVDSPMTAHLTKGPLWAKPETIAATIVRAIDKGKDDVYIPFFWWWTMFVIKHLPQAIFKKLKF